MRSSSNPFLIFLCVILPLFILTCEPDEPVAPQPEPEPEPELFEVTELVGNVQKGPYLNGSELTLAELDDRLVMTGRSFTGRITDNTGSYRFGQLSLASSRVMLTADGFITMRLLVPPVPLP